MGSLLRIRASGIWLLLVIATAISWTLGTEHGPTHDSHTLTSVIILVVALFKVRLVGLYFMQLRSAPLYLRGLFETYCLAVCGLTIGMYLFA